MEDMPRKLPAHVTRQFNKRTKKWYYYHRVGKGLRTPLPAPTDKAFDEAYKAAEFGTPKKVVRDQVDVKSIRWLMDRYRESSAWSSLSKSTKKQRDNIFKHIMDAIGSEDFRDIDRHSVVSAMEKRLSTPAQANVLLKALRGLFGWALKNDHVTVDPTAGVDWIAYKSDGFPAWTMADAQKFCETWKIGTMHRLTMELSLVSGLRRSDVHTLGRQHMKGNVLSVRTVKTGTDITIELPQRLIGIIAATPSSGLHFIESQNGRPFTLESFGNWFRKACNKAGLEGKNIHGLRKLAATLAADGGATAHQLMSQFGWANVKQAEIYTKKADRKRLGVTSSRLVAEQIEAALAPNKNTDLSRVGNNSK